VVERRRSIVFITAWFGPWPAWMRFYLQSCRLNEDIHWVLIGDAPPPPDLPDNVRVVTRTFADYRDEIACKLGIVCDWTSPYKLCDLKPFFGHLHPELVEGYDHWGFGDLDVIFGRLRHFFTEAVLDHDVISTHDDIAAGHMTLVRNTAEMNTAFRRVLGWRQMIVEADNRGFDEHAWSNLFTPVRGTLWQRLKQRLRSPRLRADGLFEEQFSTDLRPRRWIDGSQTYPSEWYWDRGRLTTDRAPDREMLYLHFSNWQSARWTDDAVAPWSRLDRLDRVPEARPDGFAISALGFRPLPPTFRRADPAADRL
jgi:hypothetical protein